MFMTDGESNGETNGDIHGENEFMLLQMKCFGLGDKTGSAEESKRTKRVQGWSRQIGLGTLFAIHCKLIVFNIMFVIYIGVNL